MGIMPYLWQGVMFWDACFSVEALTGCGNLAEAKKILEHLCVYENEARFLAKAHGCNGIRLEWTVEQNRFTKYDFLTKQIHNNSMLAYQIFLFYPQTKDEEFLKRMFHFAEQLLVFVVDGFLQDKGSHIIVKKCEGVDESTVIEKINDTWTCAITLKALMEYKSVSESAGIKPAIKNIDEIIKKLEAGLNMNIDEKKVMQSFRQGKLPHWGSLIFDLFPDHPSLKPTIEKMMENYDSKMDMYNFHGVTRYAEKMFPWANWWVVRILARNGDELCMKILENAAKYTNYHGAMPERVFYHSELFNNWFMTAHSAMVWALNGICANITGDTLRILVCCRKKWKDVQFKNIHAGDGLIVSAEMKNGRMKSLLIKNLLAERRIKCIAGNEKPFEILLKPGKNRII